MSGSSYKADVPRVYEGADLAPVKQSASASKDKVYGSLNETVVKILAAFSVFPKFVGQETFVAIDEVRGKRTEKQCVLSRGKAASSHLEVICVDGQSDFLSFDLRLQRILRKRPG